MSIYVGESRGELLAWLNDLLAPPQPITKVEQCGTGAIYCQVMDSIFGNLPMTKVKFNARQEYEHLENFKILQKCFTINKIDKPIPVDKLIKCKMQDNLEFLQWMKKFWDANAPGGGYDALGRTGGAAITSGPSSRAPANRAPPRTSASTAARSVSSTSNAQLQALTAQVQEMQLHCEGLEKERDFYFDKLRQIEVSVTKRLEQPDVCDEERDHLAGVQAVLYATQEGFEVPDPEGLTLEDDEETF
ncbi:hypothetical protein TREMEDRAFT_73748 [Tremella mesenterica DSM 1558]|uniref:uncharacterized protein n=1 Tax=Tremella mesenterica (strain ATCC 24925 / CBS 8224 / DSM 1558 / NBRC 9311 / NRRL Y-6157 / RJB 2259-6 / UBC 559-6) TaxID=578456 RepID=UPI0003F4A000|nr:uncharacterized protein TREMEDRAFT_73748 [Tremella mesenterica DSM 1558]EIW70157.1 hypothetical protein TREMEDRAFT_73748 [Tremella mesenterica DSM 1558]